MDSSWSLPLRRVPEQSTKDLSVVWNNIRLCYEQQLFGQVTSLSYNTSGSVLGGTSTNQLVLLRVPQTEGVVVNEQSDKKNFSIRFREDDKLFVQAIDQRVVVKSTETAFERQFLGHTRDVRCATFLGRHNFVSGSDDTTIKLWDLLTEDDLSTARVHTDYVRCLEPYTSGCFFSGSYDHKVCLWDPRAGFAAPVQSSNTTLAHAVEAACYVDSEEILACACGDSTILFDMRRGLTAPSFQGSFHTKTVTAVAYSTEYRALLTGSLDGRVKMFTLQSGEMQSLASKKFDNPVSCVAVHPHSKEVAVGTSKGEVNVFKFKEEPQKSAETEDADEPLLSFERRKPSMKEALQEKLHAAQHQLGSYQYNKALKTALYSRFPDVIMSTIEELIRRGALHVALSNQNDRTVARLLRFATEYIDQPQFTNTMVTVLEDIFEIYGPSVSKSVFFHREMLIAQKKIASALAVIQRMETSIGIMELIVNSS